MEGNLSNVVGPKRKDEGPAKVRGPGRPPLRRSPRVAAKSYEALSPATQQSTNDFEQLLGANLATLQGKYRH